MAQLEQAGMELVTQANTAAATARQLANDWRAATGRTELPDGIAWAWNASGDLQRIAEGVHALTVSLGEALQRAEGLVTG